MKEIEVAVVIEGWSIPEQKKHEIRDAYGEAHYLVEQIDWLEPAEHLDMSVDNSYSPSSTGGVTEFSVSDIDKVARPVISARLKFTGEEGFEQCVEKYGEGMNTVENREQFVERSPSTPREAVEEIRSVVEDIDFGLDVVDVYMNEEKQVVGVEFSGVEVSPK